MNCCNEYGDCRQGRDCPARVAKVKQRMPKHATQLRAGFTWRRNLKHLAKWLLVTVAMLNAAVIVVGCVARGF